SAWVERQTVRENGRMGYDSHECYSGVNRKQCGPVWLERSYRLDHGREISRHRCGRRRSAAKRWHPGKYRISDERRGDLQEHPGEIDQPVTYVATSGKNLNPVASTRSGYLFKRWRQTTFGLFRL